MKNPTLPLFLLALLIGPGIAPEAHAVERAGGIDAGLSASLTPGGGDGGGDDGGDEE